MSWVEVLENASRKGKYIHIGRLFGIFLEKGSELDVDNLARKYKYRVVFERSNAFDQNFAEAIFAEQAAELEIARSSQLSGMLVAHVIEQADARHAYVLSFMVGTETLVEIPEEGWPPEWKQNGQLCKRPCSN